MCCDPGSPIAKVEQGQGYYLRRALMGGGAPVTMTQARLGMLFETDTEVLDLAVSRQHKLRAIFARDRETSGQFPFSFRILLRSRLPLRKCLEVSGRRRD